MDDFMQAVRETAANLVIKFREQSKHIQFNRTLNEYKMYEDFVLNEMHKLYQGKISNTFFLKGSYFREYSEFVKFQEIPERYFIKGPRNFYFLSHRWEQSPIHPDPKRSQFKKFKEYFNKIPSHVADSVGFWYDYSCLPQADINGNRTTDEEKQFAEGLKVLHILTTLSQTVILYDDGFLDRSWCFAEWVFASSISPLLVNPNQIFPFHNMVKFRHLAILILFLSHDNEIKKHIMSGDDLIAISFINSLLKNSMNSTDATWGSDKLFLNLVVHRHFWYHVRQLGLRNQLAMAFLLLQQYDDKTVTSIFEHFLFLSEDPLLTWTRDAAIEIDTMLLENPDPFDDVHFHKNKIQVISTSKTKRK